MSGLWCDKTPDQYMHDVWHYLTLLFEPDDADKIVADYVSQMERGPIQRRANDILRAAQLEPASAEDASVLASIERLGESGLIPPVYLVVHKHGLIIADGYHRTSAVYWSNDFVHVDCFIAYA